MSKRKSYKLDHFKLIIGNKYHSALDNHVYSFKG